MKNLENHMVVHFRILLIYDIKHARFSQETAKEEFIIVEKYLIGKLGGGKINSFPC